MWKRWSHTLDPTNESLQFRNLWVLLPGFPLELWNQETFVVVGNEFGHFLHMVMKFMGKIKKFSCILVHIDIHQVLFEYIEIEWKYKTYGQNLDYWGGPL